MKLFATILRAINIETGELCTYGGPNIPAINFESAEEYCFEKYPYLSIVGELVAEIATKKDGITPDWNNMIDYETINNN